MAVRQNQGFRKDLNFQETTNETQALSNLGGVGIANDLRIIQNNLRNTSKLPFNGYSADGFFVFDQDKVIQISSITSIGTTSGAPSQYTTIDINLSENYDTNPGEVIIISGVTGIGSTVYNGIFVSNRIGIGGTFCRFEINDISYNGSSTGSDVSGATITFKPKSEFVYTNDDVVTVSTDVNVGSTTLYAGTDYYVCNTNAETKFKLSTTPSTSNLGINTVTVTSVSPTSFNFIRKDAVHQTNLVNYIQPDIQDTEDFGGYLAGSINSVFESTQANDESARYFVTQKYKGTEDTETNKEIKFEGTVKLFDPAQFNTGATQVDDSTSPGVFIGDTRAFSADNNPWEISGSTLRTFSEEVTIGDLFFYNDITITGVSTVSGSEVDVSSFTHKVPVAINGETYYLLLST